MKREKPNSTYVISVVLIIAIVIWGVLAGDSFQAAGTAAFSFLSGKFGWFYVLAMTSFVVYAIWLGFLSPYKRIPLGPDGSRPEYSNLSWFGMLFSAGMGIGLVFWGVAEPLTFWAAPPGLEPGSAEAARFAFQKVFLHWGLHPWAAYSVLALAMAYFQFRKGKPGLISSIFIPLLGEKGARGPIGKIIDILAVFATAAGIATSLGLGAMQINSGLNHVFGIPKNNLVVFLIVAVITVVYIWTALAGVDNGIKKVCDLNIIIAGVVLLLVFLVGPTVDILKSLVESLGYYVGTFPQSAMQMGASPRRATPPGTASGPSSTGPGGSPGPPSPPSLSPASPRAAPSRSSSPACSSCPPGPPSSGSPCSATRASTPGWTWQSRPSSRWTPPCS